MGKSDSFSLHTRLKYKSFQDLVSAVPVPSTSWQSIADPVQIDVCLLQPLLYNKAAGIVHLAERERFRSRRAHRAVLGNGSGACQDEGKEEAAHWDKQTALSACSTCSCLLPATRGFLSFLFIFPALIKQVALCWSCQ